MKHLFKYQIYHLAGFIILGYLLFLFSKHRAENGATILGLSAMNWITLSWIAAGAMQAWILLFWRLEFYYKKISELLGSYGFLIHRIGFVLLGTIRLLSVIPISILTENSVEINSAIKFTLIAGTTPLILWAIYSVIFYFGLNRAFGADHFFPEYRTKSLEIRGIFKFVPNSMYTVLLLLLYHPGLLYASSPGLAAAFVNHLFVWIHYFCTEKPDMKEIYDLRRKSA